MEWLVAVGIPVAGFLGACLGSWWAKRSARQAAVGAQLSAKIEGLWSGNPSRADATIEVIQHLMEHGALTVEQMMEASTQLKHYAGYVWELSEEQQRSLERGAMPSQEGRDEGDETA